MKIIDGQPNIYSFHSIGLMLMLTHAINKGIAISHSNFKLEYHLEMGDLMLSHGNYSDALSHYHVAVEADPQNYLTFYKRGTVFLALGKPKPALDDLNQVIQLKQDFLVARLQRGSVLLKLGRLDEAAIDYEWVLSVEPYNEEANQVYSTIGSHMHDTQQANRFQRDGQWPEAVQLLTRLLHEIPWGVTLREIRANAYEKLGDIYSAISDLRATTKMRSDNTDGFLKLSKLYYDLGVTDQSLNAIRECLRLDHDHKGCFNHHKKLKKLASHMKAMDELAVENRFAECLQRAEKALTIESSVQQMVHHIHTRMCHCLSKGGDSSKAIKVCSQALMLDENNVNVLCDRGDAFINSGIYDEALKDFQRASQIGEDSIRAKEGVERAQEIMNETSKRPDYYQILGVQRNADKNAIQKAYRKLASEWHPDQFNGDHLKAAVAKKFIAIAHAKEVLIDQEKHK